MSEKAQLRKLEDDLNVSGTGAILMGLWSIIRVIMQVYVELKKKMDTELAANETFEKTLVVILVMLLLGVLCAAVMMIHLYIGLNAIRAAKGMKYKKGYFAATIIFGLLTVSSLDMYLEEFRKIEDIDTTIASMLVDLTTIYIFAVIIISTVKLRKLREKEIQE